MPHRRLGDRARGSRCHPERPGPGALLPGERTRAARRPPAAGRSPASWSDNPRKGVDALGALLCDCRPRPVRADVRRPCAAGIEGFATSVAPIGLGGARSAPSRRATRTSPRASTTLARTRCSKRSPAGSPALPLQRRPSGARRRRGRRLRGAGRPSPLRSSGWPAISTHAVPRSRFPLLTDVADRYLEVLRGMTSRVLRGARRTWRA